MIINETTETLVHTFVVTMISFFFSSLIHYVLSTVFPPSTLPCLSPSLSPVLQIHSSSIALRKKEQVFQRDQPNMA